MAIRTVETSYITSKKFKTSKRKYTGHHKHRCADGKSPSNFDLSHLIDTTQMALKEKAPSCKFRGRNSAPWRTNYDAAPEDKSSTEHGVGGDDETSHTQTTKQSHKVMKMATTTSSYHRATREPTTSKHNPQQRTHLYHIRHRWIKPYQLRHRWIEPYRLHLRSHHT